MNELFCGVGDMARPPRILGLEPRLPPLRRYIFCPRGWIVRSAPGYFPSASSRVMVVLGIVLVLIGSGFGWGTQNSAAIRAGWKIMSLRCIHSSSQLGTYTRHIG